MIAQKNIRLDLQRPSPVQIIHAKQGEAYTRAINIELYNDGAAWTPPTGAHYKVSYRKPDGTGGTYDTITQGSRTLTAVSASGNILSVSLAPQVLTCAGLVTCEVHISTSATATDVLSTFSFLADVQVSAENGITSEDYWNMAKNEKVVLLNAAISETANTAQTFDPALFIPTPNLSDKVLGTNGYVGTVTAANTSTVTVRATGEQWLGGGGDVTKDYVDDLVKLGYIDKTAEYQGQATYLEERDFLRSLGAGRYYVDAVELNVFTAETFCVDGVQHSTVRSYDFAGRECCWVYENDTVRLAWEREDGSSGKYVITNGNITLGDGVPLMVRTPQADYGYNVKEAANKEYVDGRVRNGYIDMTTAAIYDDVESYEGVADYLMSLGAGRWAFNSAWEQHVEDWEYAVFVECIAYGECKHWTVRQFDDEGTQYIQMYEQYGDNERNKVLDIESTCGGPFFGFELGGMTIDNVRITHMTNNPLSATTKQYVDKLVASPTAGYDDVTEKYDGENDRDARLEWLCHLPSGKHKLQDEYNWFYCENVAAYFGAQDVTVIYSTVRIFNIEGECSIVINFLGNDGEVRKVFDVVGNPFYPVVSLPPYDSSYAGAVLRVDDNGTLYWGE